MSLSFRQSLACSALAALMCLSGPVSQAAKKPKVTGTLQDLEGREIEVTPEPVPAVTPAQAAAEYRRFLELEGGDPRLRVEAMRRLGDLSLAADEVTRGDDPAAAMTSAELTEAILLYESLIQSFPQYERNDAVMYQLARAYEAAQQPERALVILDRLVAQHPSSRRLAEAQFRRGEILFSIQRYAEAEKAYAAVIAQGAESGFYEQGLYKHGWSHFKQAHYDESVDSFLKVLDSVLAPEGTLREGSALSRPERELADDTFHVLAVMFFDQDGAGTLDGILSSRGDPVYAHLMYASLGNLYLEKERYQDAAAAFDAFARRRSGDRYAPSLQARSIDAYQKGGFSSLVLEGKQAFVERYAFGTAFWATRKPADAPEVAEQLKSNLKDLAQYHHAQAQKTRKPEDYAAATRWYQSLLDSFPEDAGAAENRYLLAELLFESGRSADAAREYERTAYEYPLHARSAAAGYAALVAYQKHEPSLTGEARAKWHRQFIESELMFANSFPEHPESGAVLTKAAESLFELNDFDRTIEVTQQVLARQPPLDAKRQRVAATLLAHSLFDRQRYSEAEAAYLRVQGLMPANDPERPAIVERIAASIYRQAEAKQASGNAGAAVDDYLRVALLAPSAKVRANAEFDAATLLVNQGDWPRAIQVLEQFRRGHPDHELAPEVTRKLAVGYQETGQRMAAAAEYEKIAAGKTETADVRRAALWQAADLYSQAAQAGQSGAAARAATAYTNYVAQFPMPLDAAMDARQRLVDFARVSRDEPTQKRWLEEIIRADKAAGAARTSRSRYLAAKATLTLTEPTVAAFNAIKLTAPLTKSLKAKRASMEKVLSAYGQALDYGVAEVTTAATYGMAEVYRQLGADVMASERPKNLDAESLEQYELLLEEQAFPFEEKAIELHQANAQRSADGVYDEWVKRSFEVLAKLVPGRYARAEIGEDYVPALR